MRKRALRIVALVALVALTAVALAGCGGNSSKDDMSKEVKLIYYTIGDTPKDNDMVVAKLNEYLKQKINTTVEIRYIPFGDYSTKMNTMAASGDKYDIAFTCSWAFNYVQGVNKGYFAELDSLLENQGKDLKSAIATVFWDGSLVKGKHYAIPTQKEAGAMEYFRFQKDFLDKANIDVSAVNSLESVEPALAKAHSAYPNMVTFVNNYRFYGYDYIIKDAFPGAVKISDTGLKVINQYQDADFVNKLKVLRKYYQAGYVPKDIAQKPDQVKFNDNRLFCDIQEAGPNADAVYSGELGKPVVTRPAYPGKAYATTGSVTGSMVAISSNSDNPERAMMLLTLINTDAYVRNLLAFGLEGKNYTKTGDTSISRTPAQAKDYTASPFSTGNMFILYTLNDQPKTMWADYKAFNDNLDKSPLLGFCFDPDPVKMEISSITGVMDEYTKELNAGEVDVDKTIDSYVAKSKAAGLDKVLAEMQKQIDAWKAANK